MLRRLACFILGHAIPADAHVVRDYLVGHCGRCARFVAVKQTTQNPGGE